jgi:hypothetical protein
MNKKDKEENEVMEEHAKEGGGEEHFIVSCT